MRPIVLVLIPIVVLAGPRPSVGQEPASVREPCRERLAALQDLADQDSLSVAQVETAYEHAVALYETDAAKGCGTAGRFEAELLRDAVVKSGDPGAVAHFIAYLKATRSSAAESPSLHFEQIFAVYPGATIRYAEDEPEDVRTRLAIDLAWGFLNNTHPDGDDRPVAHFWTRHEALKRQGLDDSPFIQTVVAKIQAMSP